MFQAYYKEEMERLLGDADTYTPLLSNPVKQYRDELSILVTKGMNKNILCKKETNYVNPSSCCTPVISLLLKIHKDNENPPGRPIVNGVDSLTSRLGQYLDYFLQPLVTSTPV